MNSSKIVLTTQDIVNKEFTIEPKGFKPQEVDGFLDIVIKDYVAFIRNETLALNMERVSEVDHIEKINDFEVGIKLEKIEEEKK